MTVSTHLGLKVQLGDQIQFGAVDGRGIRRLHVHAAKQHATRVVIGHRCDVFFIQIIKEDASRALHDGGSRVAEEFRFRSDVARDQDLLLGRSIEKGRNGRVVGHLFRHVEGLLCFILHVKLAPEEFPEHGIVRLFHALLAIMNYAEQRILPREEHTLGRMCQPDR